MNNQKLVNTLSSSLEKQLQKVTRAVSPANRHIAKNSSISIPELKQEMLDVINQKRNQQVFKKLHKKYPTPISLLHSYISIPTAEEVNRDFPQTVLQLQLYVTEEILLLREQKLTLMEEYNKLIENRFRIQRQLLKIKNCQNREEKNEEIQDINIFNEDNLDEKKRKEGVLQKIQNSESKYFTNNPSKDKSRKISNFSQSEEMLSEIEKLKQSSRFIQHKITLNESNPNTKYSIPKLDELGFSMQYEQKNDKTSQNSLSFMEEIRKLRDRRYQLYYLLASYSKSKRQQQIMCSLIEQHKELLQTVKKNENYLSLNDIKQKVRRQKGEKQKFVGDLQKFKAEVKRARDQNAYLRSALKETNHFYSTF